MPHLEFHKYVARDLVSAGEAVIPHSAPSVLGVSGHNHFPKPALTVLHATDTVAKESELVTDATAANCPMHTSSLLQAPLIKNY